MDGVYGEPYESGPLQLTHDQIIRDESWRETKHSFEARMRILLGSVAIIVAVMSFLSFFPVSALVTVAAMLGGQVGFSLGAVSHVFAITCLHLLAICKGVDWIYLGFAELTRGPNARDLK